MSNHFDYLASKGQAIILLNCRLYENHILCGCALFFTKIPQKLFYGKEIINSGRKILIPEELQIETYARLTDINNDIRLFFEQTNE